MIAVKLSALKTTTFTQHALRFVFGGIAVVLTGLIAKRFGAVIGGLFLAFPAIFPASVTLIERHQQKKKAQIGYDGTRRGREAAGLESAGTALGALSLMLFGLIVWKLLPGHGTVGVFTLAGVAWMVLAAVLWLVRRHV